MSDPNHEFKTRFAVTVIIDCDDEEEAEKILRHRIDCDEDLGFPYEIQWEEMTEVYPVGMDEEEILRNLVDRDKEEE